ncbi:MAG: hypothetical protein K9M99_12975 [Candidatus Cloacimonetes bacterium]|nr:hypothetical protein [Candidatus Cloacimonadota bacterium]
MKKILVICFMIFMLSALWSDFSGMNNGTRSLGMGNAYSALAEGVESLYYNPAGTAGLDDKVMGLSYQNHYGISDLLNLNMTAAIPWKQNVYGMAIQQVNLLDVYYEDIFYLNMSRSIKLSSGSLNLGINGKYFLVSGNEAEVSLDTPYDIDIGAVYMNKGFHLAYSSRNLARLGGDKDEMGSSQLIGIAFKWQDLLNLTSDYEITENESFFRLGIELWFYDTFAPRLGFDDEYLTMGFGLKSNWWEFNFGLKTHEELGTTYRFGMTLKYKEK